MYQERWKQLYEGLFPEEITVFGHTLKRKEYLAIAGLGLLILIGLGFYLNKRYIMRQIDSYYGSNIDES